MAVHLTKPFFYVAVAVAGILLSLVPWLLHERYEQKRRGLVPRHRYLRAPLTLSMSVEGRFVKGCSWDLSVNSARQAELTVYAPLNTKRKKFIITKEQFDKLRETLADSRFFELDPRHGMVVPDGSSISLVVSIGRFSNAVSILYVKDILKSGNVDRDLVTSATVCRFMSRFVEDESAFDIVPKCDQIISCK